MADEVEPKDPPSEDPPKNDPPKNDPPKNDPPKEDPPDELEAKIKKVLTDMGVGGTRPAPIASRQNIEQMAEDMVRQASEKLHKEQEREELLTGVRQDVDQIKEKLEETPRKVRRLTKVLWGDEK